MSNYYPLLCSSNSAIGLNYSDDFFGPIFGRVGQGVTDLADFRMPIRDTMTWSNLAIYVVTNGNGNPVTTHSRVSGVNGNQTFVVATNTTGYFEDTTHSDSLTNTSAISYYFHTSSGGSFLCEYISSLLTSANTKVPLFSMGTNSMSYTLGQYLSITGYMTASTTADYVAVKAQAAASVTQLAVYVYIASNATMTAKVYVNTGAGNNTITITANTTGLFEDTTPHTDSITAGQMVSCVITGAGSNPYIHFCGVQWDSTNYPIAIPNFSSTNNRYYVIGTSYDGIGTTEAKTQYKVKQPLTFTNLQIYTSAYTSTGTLILRKNGSTGLSQAITSTGWTLNTGTLSVVDTDLLDYLTTPWGTLTTRQVSIDVVQATAVVSVLPHTQPYVHLLAH